MSMSLETIGELTVSVDGKELQLQKSKRNRALLAYLAITKRPHPRLLHYNLLIVTRIIQ